ncbi:MAG: ABC transporter permease [Bauldia sp.]|nr:ABC transporter permease [Bauldia sp.]
MLVFLARRLVALVLILLTMTFIVFCLQRVVPTDPVRALAGPNAPVEVVDRMREEMGLNDPLPVQYGRFVAGLVEGDLGTSVRTRKPIAEDLARYAPASIELMIWALILGVAAGSLVAVVQSLRRRTDGLRLLLMAAGSLPIFLTALLLTLIFWFDLGWLPGAGRLSIRGFDAGPTGLLVLDGLIQGRLDVVGNAIAHLILPATALALPIAVAVARSLHGSLVAVLRQPYIRTARGNGLTERRVILRHGVRNAAAAPLAMVGLQIGLLFANLLIVERIFAWPGLGLYTVQAFDSSDLPAVLGVAVVFGAFYVIVNIVVDVLQSWADPRVRLG